MKSKTIKLLSLCLFLSGILGIISVGFYTWNNYMELTNLGGSIVAKYYISSAVPKELFINLSSPVFACAFSFFITRAKFSEKNRIIIRYITYGASFWLLTAVVIFLLEINGIHI